MIRTGFLSLTLVLCACTDIAIDPDEGPGQLDRRDAAEVEFNPPSALPFPNDLVISRETGKVGLPAQCGESEAQTALRTRVLNALDGFGTYGPVLRVTVTKAVDAASLQGRVVLYKAASAAGLVVPGEGVAVPVVAVPGITQRFDEDCQNPTLVQAIHILPVVPLEEGSTYTVGLLDGITAEGKKILPSTLWSLVRQEVNPVTVEAGKVVAEETPFDPRKPQDVEKMLGIDLLWRAHAPAVQFLAAAADLRRNQLVIAWAFTTQTISEPLDGRIAGTPAAELSGELSEVRFAGLPGSGADTLISVTGGDAEAFLAQRLGEDACAAVGCDRVGDVLSGVLVAPNYQLPLPNPLGRSSNVPGPWTDPLTPTAFGNAEIPVLVAIPKTPQPVGGYPTVIFGHGLGRSKNDSLALVSQLAGGGFAVAAMDWVSHGDRAVQISGDPTRGCEGEPDPTVMPQCFAPALTTNLVVTRDNLRQSVLDGLALVEALKGCTGDRCGALTVDASRLGYVGQSLGAILGSVLVSMSADIGAAVLNVGGVGLLDLLENTETLTLRCPLVDSLIAQGVIQGSPLDLTDPDNPTGACVTKAWAKQPGYQAFAGIARWVLDPADGVNYLPRLANRPILFQKVVGDRVVPNVTTDQIQRLLGLKRQQADRAASASPEPSRSISVRPTETKFVSYKDLSGNDGPPNTFTHGSLLNPGDMAPTQLGLARIQTDALTYLGHNLAAVAIPPIEDQ